MAEAENATDARRTATVESAVRANSRESVHVTQLIDHVLAAHEGDYLRGWARRPPTWPSDILEQPVDQWMSELGHLLDTELVFGRVAIVAWSLLDDQVAQEAVRSGILGGIVSEVDPGIADFLSPAGLRLLRRRAPTVAWSAGLLEPDVALQGVGDGSTAERLALAPTRPSRTGVGRWAAAAGATTYVGDGASSSIASTVPQGRVHALTFTRAGDVCTVASSYPAVHRWRPDLGDVPDDDWPAASSGAASPTGLAIISRSSDNKWPTIQWGVPDGGPVTLDPPAGKGEDLPDEGGSALAVHDKHVALFDLDGRLWLGGADAPWQEAPFYDEETSALSADAAGVACASRRGGVSTCPWPKDGAEPTAQDWVRTEALPGHVIQSSAGGHALSVVASESAVALVREGVLEARWRPEEGQRITAVALSPDGATLAIAGPSMLRIWRIDSSVEVRLTSYSADTPEGEDLLGIQPTVDALAAVVAAIAVEPPLSVGLFGAWGSGKSFFMRHVERRIDEITDESRASRRPQSSLWAWRNIRHVHFNAWQYAAADVWAGLLEQLIGQLARPPERGRLELQLPPELDELHKQRITRLSGAVADAALATQHLHAARQEHARSAQEAIRAQESLLAAQALSEASRGAGVADVVKESATDALDEALARAGLPPLGADLRDTWREVQSARRANESVGGLTQGDPRWLTWAVVAAPVLGVAVGAAWVAANLAAPGLTGMLASVLVVVSGVALWVRSGAQRISERLRRLDEVDVQARAVEQAARQQEAEARCRLLRAEARVRLRNRRVERAHHAVEVAQAAVDSATPGNLLLDYLAGRADSDDYRSLLGLIGTVHRDLRVVSKAVEEHNLSLLGQADAALDDVVNRVVLYVDDLDRCRPEVVVKVLEAVSMLMSFPMFVVVVAVDSHWISRSLRSVYPEMFKGGEVTSDHYLEKIFQLPVWLDQPAVGDTRRMTLALLGGDGVLAPNGRGPAAATASAEPSPAATRGARSGGGPDGSSPTTKGVPAERQRNIALATTLPEAVRIDADESRSIAQLAPLLTRSPRALKRYLNTYRLLKAIVDPDDLETARFLLALATGRPRLGDRLFDQITAFADSTTLGEVTAQWPTDDREALELVHLAWQSHRCDATAPVVAQVRRFVFRSDVDGDA